MHHGEHLPGGHGDRNGHSAHECADHECTYRECTDQQSDPVSARDSHAHADSSRT